MHVSSGTDPDPLGLCGLGPIPLKRSPAPSKAESKAISRAKNLAEARAIKKFFELSNVDQDQTSKEDR